jgi:hypothetical protein
MRSRLPRLLLVLSVAGMTLGGTAWLCASADDAQPGAKPAAPPNQPPPAARTPEQVLASLNRAMTWYRQARIVMRSVEGSGVFGPADEQTALRLVGRAFDVARAEAALLRRDQTAASGAVDRRAEEQKKRETAVRQGEKDVARLRARIRAEPERRAALEREAAAAQNKLELDRARLEFFDQLGGLESSRSGGDDDLEHQIEALQEAVPELRSSTASQPVASAATGSASGTWGRAPAPARAAAQPEPPGGPRGSHR